MLKNIIAALALAGALVTANVMAQNAPSDQASAPTACCKGDGCKKACCKDKSACTCKDGCKAGKCDPGCQCSCATGGGCGGCGGK